MKALFVYSGFVYRFKNKYYTLNLTPTTLHRLYFPFCSELTICERLKDVNDVEGLTEIDSKDIKILCPEISASANSLYFLNSVKYYNFIKSIIRDYDFVIARQGLLGNFAASLSRKYKIPYIYESVGSTFASFWNHGIAGKLISIPLTVYVAECIKNSKYVTYVTERYLQKLYPTNGKSVGVSDVEILDVDECVLKRRIERINSLVNIKSLKMVTIGGINAKVKGQRFAIQALRQLNQMDIRVDYYLVGEGSSLNLKKLSLELGIENQVHFIGPLRHDEIFEFLDTMDIYIQPSLQEGLPRAVVEAMSRGLLCVASNIAGLPELISEEMLFKPKDVNAITRIISHIDRQTLLNQAIKNFERAKDFQKSSLALRRSDFFNDFINDNF